MIPSQQEANFQDPEEHFLWALRNLPVAAGSGAITHVAILRGWAKHLWDCAFFHRDYLVSIADSDGNINVKQLREQKIRFRPAVRGPYHSYNNAAGWVEKNSPDPEPQNIQDVRKLTIQEQHVVADMLRETGVIKDQPPQWTPAAVIND
jgi:hypothetical protein